MATKRLTERVLLRSALFHWGTFSLHVHGWTPNPESRADLAAFREVIANQAFGKLDKTLDYIEEIVRAPLTARSFAARYVEFIHWIDCGAPKRFVAPNPLQARSLRRLIALNLRGAA